MNLIGFFKDLSIIKALKRKEKVFVFGDSHVEVFRFFNKAYPKSSFDFDVTLVEGATAQGLVNPNSKTQCLSTFMEKISTIEDKNHKLIFLLGEVDTGFVIWYRAQKYNEPIEFQLKRSIRNLFGFLSAVQARGFYNIFLMSTPLPTIRDNQDMGHVANLRKEVRASQLERTKLTLEYNQELERLCGLNGYKFIGVDDLLLDKKTGLILDQFLNLDPYDHHLDLERYSKVCYDRVVVALK